MSGASSIFIMEDWASPLWRLNTIYSIVDAEGKVIPFRMNDQQIELYSFLWTWNLVLKSRQQGFSTAIGLFGLDQSLFSPNFTMGLIAQTEDDVTDLFKTKILNPYDQLPSALRDSIGVKRRNTTEIEFGNGSVVKAGQSMRGSALQFLHVSEFGKICAKAPERAREIVTGAFETLAVGQMLFVESTAEGQDGYFHDYSMEALKAQQEGAPLSKLDFRLHFFPWWRKKTNVLDPAGVIIEPQHTKYFDDLKYKRDIELSPEQKAWYVKKLGTLKSDMTREHPSYPEEAFEQSIIGAIYGDEMAWLRKHSRITSVPHDPSYPVNSFWDLGTGDSTSIWLHQSIGLDDRFIHYYENAGQGMKHYYNWLSDMKQEHDFTWGKHYLPHDADNDLQGEVIETRVSILERLGLRGIETVDRIADLVVGVDLTRTALRSAAFDKENCIQGIKCLDNYQRKWSEKLGRWEDRPLHNWASNGADALRQWAQGFKRPSLAEREKRPKRDRNWKTR